MFYANLEFSAIISFFSALPAFSSLSRTLMTQMLDLLLLSHKSPRLFSFLPLFLCLCLSLSQTIFSVMFRLGNSYGSIFQFTDAFLCPSILIHVCLSIDFLFWLLHFAVLAFSFSSSLYFLFLYFLFFLFSISLLRLYIFLLVSS